MKNLKAEMMRQSKSREDLAKLIGVSISTVNNKLTGRMDFKMQEAIKIKTEWFPDLTLEYLFNVNKMDRQEGIEQ